MVSSSHEQFSVHAPGLKQLGSKCGSRANVDTSRRTAMPPHAKVRAAQEDRGGVRRTHQAKKEASFAQERSVQKSRRRDQRVAGRTTISAVAECRPCDEQERASPPAESRKGRIASARSTTPTRGFHESEKTAVRTARGPATRPANNPVRGIRPAEGCPAPNRGNRSRFAPPAIPAVPPASVRRQIGHAEKSSRRNGPPP